MGDTIKWQVITANTIDSHAVVNFYSIAKNDVSHKSEVCYCELEKMYGTCDQCIWKKAMGCDDE